MGERESTVFNGIFILTQVFGGGPPAGVYRALVSLRGGPRVLLFKVTDGDNAAPPHPAPVLTISCDNARVKWEGGKVRIILDAAPGEDASSRYDLPPPARPAPAPAAALLPFAIPVSPIARPPLEAAQGCTDGKSAEEPAAAPPAADGGPAAPRAPPDCRELAAAARAQLPQKPVLPPPPVSFVLTREVLPDDAEHHSVRARWNRFAVLLGVCWEPVRDRMQRLGLAARARPGDGTLVPSTYMRSLFHELGSPRGRRSSVSGAPSPPSRVPPRRCRSAEPTRVAYGRALFAPSHALLDPSSSYLLPSFLFHGIDTPDGRWPDAVKALTEILRVARASGGESPTYEQRHNLSRRQYRHRILCEAISRWTAALNAAPPAGAAGGGGWGRNRSRRGGGRPSGADEAPWRRPVGGGEEWRGAGRQEGRGPRGGGETGRAWGPSSPGGSQPAWAGGQLQLQQGGYNGSWYPSSQRGGGYGGGYGYYPAPPQPSAAWNGGQAEPQGYGARGASSSYYTAPQGYQTGQAWNAAFEQATGQSAAAWAFYVAQAQHYATAGGLATAGMPPGLPPTMSPSNGGPHLTVITPSAQQQQQQTDGLVTPPGPSPNGGVGASQYTSVPSRPRSGVAYAMQLVSTPQAAQGSSPRLPEVDSGDGPGPVPPPPPSQAERRPAAQGGSPGAQRGGPPVAAKPRAPAP